MFSPETRRMLWYSLGSLPTGMLLLCVGTWLMRLYCPSSDEVGRPLLVSPVAFGAVSSAVMIVGAIADPLVGFYSDRFRGKGGRRLPFIRLFTPFLALCFTMLWFPPVKATSLANTVHLALMLGGVHVFFTLVVNPYLALMPEVWRLDSDRVRVSAFMAAFNALAQLLAFGLFGVLISALHQGIEVPLLGHMDGFEVGGIVFGLLTVACFYPTLRFIKETPPSPSKEVKMGLWEAGIATLKNPAFLPYIVPGALLYAAQFLIEGCLPYLVVTEVVRDKSRADMVAAAMLTGLVVVTAALFPLVDRLSHRFRKRQMFMFSLLTFGLALPVVTSSGQVPGIPALAQVLFACLLVAPALAVGLVIPRAILAEVMDHDTRLTGYRREAMYNGMEGLLQKAAGGIAPLLQGVLFSTFGFSHERPFGIVLSGVAGGLLCLIGAALFTRYPLDRP